MHVSSMTFERGKRVYPPVHEAARFELDRQLFARSITGFSVLLITVGPLVTPVSGSGLEHELLATRGSSCSGVRVLPGVDLQAKINSRPGGTTFCLKKGIHPLATGALVKSHDRIIGEPGAVLDGQNVAHTGLWGYGGSTGQKGVVVAGVGLRNFRGPAIKAGWNWVVSRNNIRNSEIGVVGQQRHRPARQPHPSQRPLRDQRWPYARRLDREQRGRLQQHLELLRGNMQRKRGRIEDRWVPPPGPTASCGVETGSTTTPGRASGPTATSTTCSTRTTWWRGTQGPGSSTRSAGTRRSVTTSCAGTAPT